MANDAAMDAHLTRSQGSLFVSLGILLLRASPSRRVLICKTGNARRWPETAPAPRVRAFAKWVGFRTVTSVCHFRDLTSPSKRQRQSVKSCPARFCGRLYREHALPSTGQSCTVYASRTRSGERRNGCRRSGGWLRRCNPGRTLCGNLCVCASEEGH